MADFVLCRNAHEKAKRPEGGGGKKGKKGGGGDE